MTELTERRSKLADAERQLWFRLEQSRITGASSDVLAELGKQIVQLRQQGRELSQQIYANTCLRDGKSYDQERERAR